MDYPNFITARADCFCALFDLGGEALERARHDLLNHGFTRYRSDGTDKSLSWIAEYEGYVFTTKGCLFID